MARRRRRIDLAIRDPRRTWGDGDRSLARKLSLAYSALALVGGGLAWRFAGGRPFEHPTPWLELSPAVRVGSSAALGVALAFGVVVATRITVARYRWAQALHAELQPVARRFRRAEIVLVALLSSLGEELFFRGFLSPTIGLVASTVLFGLLHQVRGSSRWVWVAWASVVGLVLGTIHAATGSLVGPVLAHALVNATNLEFLRSYDLPSESAAARTLAR